MDTNTITFQNAVNHTHIFRLTTPNTYAVTARIKGGKGTVSHPGLTELTPGAAYALTVTPDDGYEVAAVTVNGQSVTLEDNILKLDAVNENAVIEVKFNKLPQLVAITEYVEELIVLDWPVSLALMAALAVACWGITKGVKALRRKIEEGGY